MAHAPRTAVLRLGFLPSTDAAPLIVAHEQGFFRQRGLQVELRREVGWATIRDKVAFGELDAAHAPAALLWAMQLGLEGAPVNVCTGFVFNLHGGAITLSQRLWQAGARDATSVRTQALARRGENRFTFGLEHPFSGPHLLLRAWLRQLHLDPDVDVRLALVPANQLVRNLGSGVLDGYCASEPWNSVAVAEGTGWCPAWSAGLMPGWPDKVLLVRTALPQQRAAEHAALVGALTESARWCEDACNRESLAALLAQPSYLGVAPAAVAPALGGRFHTHAHLTEDVPNFLIFHRLDANVPTGARAAAVQRELVLAGLVPAERLEPGLPERLFREDLHREAREPAPEVVHAPAR